VSDEESVPLPRVDKVGDHENHEDVEEGTGLTSPDWIGCRRRANAFTKPCDRPYKVLLEDRLDLGS